MYVCSGPLAHACFTSLKRRRACVEPTYGFKMPCIYIVSLLPSRLNRFFLVPPRFFELLTGLSDSAALTARLSRAAKLAVTPRVFLFFCHLFSNLHVLRFGCLIAMTQTE